MYLCIYVFMYLCNDDIEILPGYRPVSWLKDGRSETEAFG